ncbi:MAG TPA: bifunctional 4-hydroxy-2-oxoglutarate aldolase/2-dehydro-3-deoxy-phosphogluconate aldolase [Rhodocyclaceae bacterium]|nr:bifunctional 4-hydroxy-2-oxoglutarate aldolase/2-dehydro-3-deoxy-phosphogluconate aldolase [Rhodocyclaceae bacterium]
MTAKAQTLDGILGLGPVMPVLVIETLADAVPLARALVDNGIRVLEVTLRTPDALAVIARLADAVPDAVVGAGTVVTPEQLAAAERAGARFAVSPGLTPGLLAAARDSAFPLLPGVMTASEAMTAAENGFTRLKLFPAQQAGGVGMLKALAGPLPGLRFCPTGGVTVDNAGEFLALPNVICVGGSWLAPAALMQARDWAEIGRRARRASQLPR